jgi:hypothetical protein
VTSRKLLQRKIYDIENDLRGSCVILGLRLVLLAPLIIVFVNLSQIIHSLLPLSAHY